MKKAINMKTKIISFLFFVIPGVLTSAYPDYLRQGVNATEAEITVATEMYNQGWRYTMPTPISVQAEWGNTDRRTKWNEGGWRNEATGAYSYSTPRKDTEGKYIGDGQNTIRTERRGSPGRPDVYMFLLSHSGGPRGAARSDSAFGDILN
jgi:hypothetical protein